MTPQPGVPLTDDSDFKVGDVLVLATKQRDKSTGESFWWKRFVIVIAADGLFGTQVLALKLRPDMEKDIRQINFKSPDQVITFLPEDQHPQGVIAMRMKLIMQGVVKLSED